MAHSGEATRFHPEPEKGSSPEALRREETGRSPGGRNMKALVEFYFTAARFAIACLLGCMVVLVFGNVVLRYAFNQGITVSEELSRIFFVWLTFLGAVVAMRDHAHLGVDSLVRRLSPAGARIALVAGHIMMFGATWLVLSGSFTQTLINIPTLAPATGMSMGWFYGAGLAFAVPALLIIAWNGFGIATGRIDVASTHFVTDSEEHVTPVSTDEDRK